MAAPARFCGAKRGRMIGFVRAHKRVITLSLVAFGAFWLAPSWGEAGPLYFLLFFPIFVMLIISQLFWVRRVSEIRERMIPTTPWPQGLRAVGFLLSLFPLPFNRIPCNHTS